MAEPGRKVVLIVRDGWGHAEEGRGNAVSQADTPNNDRYMKEYPNTILKCTGNAVGLPEGTQGGSEPGHLTMGAGRVVWQPYEDINRKIKSGEFFKNRALMKAMDNCKSKGTSLHLMGLFSDEGIHGTVEHLYALMEMAKRNGIRKVFVHCFLDGRDVPERSATKYVEQFREKSEEMGIGKIATMAGRYYAMDRDTNWDRTERAYRMLVHGEGFKEDDPLQAILNAYERGDKTDYYVKPVVITEGDRPVATIKDGDSVVFWNFRSDRARQITYALTQADFDKFDRGKVPDIVYVCMSNYDKNLTLPVAFPQLEVRNNIGNVISENGLRQLRIAETEKYAHVTFFFNSQVEEPNPGEDRIMVPSPKVPSYDQKPEMSAYGITNKLVPEIEKGKYDFILVNYANGDLVGHSANLEAGIKACEAVDECTGRVVETALSKGYVCIITGDHGNIECMFYPNGKPNPSHGTNPVPFILVSEELKGAKLKEGMGLKDIAPTILGLMGIEKPKEMEGESIIAQ
ncbi:MAG: 2,3-bisphosphoglycerate-independent phosphoglycerate mutase [Candidatus Aenigmatarchaeota archaeon]|nr:MAG: 2,3-bisphosphoglycerate-independent phosphoglycerate mutase [Candidatus Aenigmarchaeota archaeon]